VPKAILQSASLLSLDLSHNQLTDWPFLTASPPKLTTLRLYGNLIGALPHSTTPMPQLKELSLGSNSGSITELPASFISAFPALQSLRAWGSLTTIPATLSMLENLEELDLRANKLNDESWAVICKLTQLRALHLQENQLSSLPQSFGELKQLRNIELQKNRIKSTSAELWASSKLEKVDLSDNLITALPGPEQSLPELKELWLARNQLNSLPDALQHFCALRNLDLEDNRLTTLPPSVLEMPKLSEPILTGNAFSEDARPLMQSLEDILYQRNPFARVHWPRFQSQAAIPNSTNQALPLSDEVLEQAQRLGAQYRKQTHNEESWPTAAHDWPLTVAFQSWLYDLEWPEHCYFDFHDKELKIWSVDFSKPRPVADFECSFSHPYICLADYHGGNELLLIRLDDDVPGNPMLYHLDHEDGSVPDAEPLKLRLSTFLSKLQRN
ncbi:MAG: leucine-rich repeat domain-containing protein, partial [Planctomycetota bacterium]|nr:leucine-rich repeat domain-containing protein [Planctomycetota bacterium]